MEFSWTITVLAVLGNTCFCVAQYLAQQWELAQRYIQPRHSIIKGTNQKFLHWQDFTTQTWGDLVGLALVWGGFWHLKTSEVSWSAFGLLTTIGSGGFMYMCAGPNHKPDWGWPKVKEVSLGGLFHVVYFGLSFAAAGTCIWKMIDGTLSGVPMIVALAGGLFWVCTAVGDAIEGRFEPLKLITPPPSSSPN